MLTKTKQDILYTLEEKLGGARDTFNRADVRLRRHPLNQIYGESGKTGQQILDECQADKERWEEAVRQVEAIQAS